MIIKQWLVLLVLGAVCVSALLFPGTEVSDPRDIAASLPPLALKGRQERMEAAVHGFLSAQNAGDRRAFVRRQAFVDAALSKSLGAPLEIDEVGELRKGDVVLTMVRARFKDGHVSLLLEELRSGRFVVDSETAEPEQPERWSSFRRDRVKTSQAFRIYGSLSDYYNFEFDQEGYVALEIEVPGSEDTVTGYVNRATQGSRRLLESLEGQISVPLILSLRHPELLKDESQVVIDRFIQRDWVILDEAIAPVFDERELVSR